MGNRLRGLRRERKPTDWKVRLVIVPSCPGPNIAISLTGTSRVLAHFIGVSCVRLHSNNWLRGGGEGGDRVVIFASVSSVFLIFNPRFILVASFTRKVFAKRNSLIADFM